MENKAGRPVDKGGFWTYDTITKGDVPITFDEHTLNNLKFLLMANPRIFR